MTGGFQYVGRGLGIGLAFFVLLYFFLNGEERQKYEEELIRTDPVAGANEAFANGNIFFYEILETNETKLEEGASPWKVCGAQRIKPEILQQYTNRERFEKWTTVLMSPSYEESYRKADRFGARFNQQMATRIESSVDKSP